MAAIRRDERRVRSNLTENKVVRRIEDDDAYIHRMTAFGVGRAKSWANLLPGLARLRVLGKGLCEQSCNGP